MAGMGRFAGHLRFENSCNPMMIILKCSEYFTKLLEYNLENIIQKNNKKWHNIQELK